MKLGWASTRLVAGLAGSGEKGAESLEFGDLTGVAFAVYTRERAGKPGARLDPVKMGLGDWQTVVRVRDADEQVLVLAKSRRGGIHKMMFFSVEADKVTVASLRGSLDMLFESVMRGAEKGGSKGARRAVNLKAVNDSHGSHGSGSSREPAPSR